MKYEIEHCHVDDEMSYQVNLAALISIVTGLPLWNTEEVGPGVWARLPERMRTTEAGWYSREFPKLLRSLGYDCSPDFRTRFDPATRYPCLLRFVPGKVLLARETVRRRQEAGNPDLKPNRWWNVVAYYDGLVYDPGCIMPYPLADFPKEYTITTMLQVWVGAL